MWIYVICFSSLSVGGILSAARYISNEGWWLKREDIPESLSGVSSVFQPSQMVSIVRSNSSDITIAVDDVNNVPKKCKCSYHDTLTHVYM